jgi:ParB family chromosome partitioning protein
VQRQVASGVLSAGHARALLGAADASRMEYFATKTINEGLSVRSLEEIVGIDKPESKKPKIIQGTRQDLLKEISEGLGDQLNTTVKIALGRKKGQLIIDFATVADLNRILDEIGYKKKGS